MIKPYSDKNDVKPVKKYGCAVCRVEIKLDWRKKDSKERYDRFKEYHKDCKPNI